METNPAPADSVLGDWQPLSRAMDTAMAAATMPRLVEALDELRRERELSYARLGRKAQAVPGISRTSAHAVIKGKRDLDLALLRGFLVVCEVSSEERLRWLGAFDRLVRSAEPEIMVRATLPAAQVTAPAPAAPAHVDPPPRHDVAWPSLQSVRRAHPRKRRAPDHVHRHLPWLLIPGIGAPLCAILFMRYAIPVPTILGFFVLATLGLALWTVHLPGIDTGRRRGTPYVRKVRLEEDLDVFGPDRRAAPPVIGL
ncbi:hypothetical protein GCM10010492_50370 [Saccharothrix mutabilis subsp. mutabilis]|uniref:HTH cro/C1-type domain-containing protein n=1 Tax=Saccharothrix mutabilis subsp. mutabilis TaxID=66855 RepID=A0ABP3DWB4_9PSEU